MTKIIQFLIIFILLTQLSYSQENSPLLILEKGGYGYINEKGEVVISPAYRWAYDFVEGLAVVRLKSDTDKTTDGIMDGIINKFGKIIFKIEKGQPDLYYSEGLLRVENWEENRVVYYDTAGKIVIDKNIVFGWEFSGGFAPVKFSKNGKIGFINKLGDLVIDTIYSSMGRFHNGYTYIFKDDECGLLDTVGNFIKLKCLDDDISKIFKSKFNSKCFSNTGDFQYGLMPVKKGGLCGYINTSGEYVINPIFSEACNFSDGLAAVKYKGKYGYIDTTGSFIIEPQFRYAESFSEGLAFVYTETDFKMAGPHTNAVINKTGEVVINVDTVLGIKEFIEDGEKGYIINMFYGASKFKNGIAKFYEGYHFSGRIRYINKNGKLIW